MSACIFRKSAVPHVPNFLFHFPHFGFRVPNFLNMRIGLSVCLRVSSDFFRARLREAVCILMNEVTVLL